MCFSANLKKSLAGLLLAGSAAWFAGCSETASTPKMAPSTSGSTSTSPKVNSDGSVKASTDSNAKASTESNTKETADKGTGSSSDEEMEKPTADGDEQAGSSTGGGREVPEATP